MTGFLTKAERYRIARVLRTEHKIDMHRMRHLSQVAQNYRSLLEIDNSGALNLYKRLRNKNKKVGNISFESYSSSLQWIKSIHDKLPLPIISSYKIRSIFGESNNDWMQLFKNPEEKILVFKENAGQMIEENTRFSSMKGDLLGLLKVAKESTIAFPAFEAGIRLHDIGYAKSGGSDHTDRGFEMLNDSYIQERLNLTSTQDFNTISQMAQHHGLLSDVGYLYHANKAEDFSYNMLIALAVINALDTTARPLENGYYHSMLFPRLIDRLKRFVDERIFLDSPEDRLRQLFGPANYVWLDESAFQELDSQIEQAGLIENPGFKLLLEKTFFHCWGLLKDIVSAEISIAKEFYIPLKQNKATKEYLHMPHLVTFLAVISEILNRVNELSPLSSDCIVETHPDLNYGPINNRFLYLNFLRVDLESIPAADVKKYITNTNEGYQFKNQLFSVLMDGKDVKISLGPKDFNHFRNFKKALGNNHN